MKSVTYFVLLALLGAIGILGADVFYSTSSGGYWNDGDTWVGTGLTPGPDDDVFIYGPVLVPYPTGIVNCHNLTVDGSAAVLRNSSNEYGTVNIDGDLALLNDGKIMSNTYNNRHITVNLAGDFSQAGLCQPQSFNFTGSLDRQLSQSPGYSLAPYLNVTVPAGVTLYINTDFAVSSSHASANASFTWSTTTSNYYLVLAESADLTFTNVNLRRANVSGGGTNALVWENTRSGWMEYCSLESVDIQSTGVTQLGAGVVFSDVVNQATLCNRNTGSQILTMEGDFHNYGELKANPDAHVLNVTSNGNLYNHGFFQPATLTLTGSGERYLYSSAAHPFRATSGITINASVGTIHATSDLHFYNCVQLTGGTFSLSNGGGGDFDLYLTGCRTTGSTFLGGSASILQASSLVALNTSIQNFAIYGDISFASGGTLTDVVNHGILQNTNTASYTISINGNFPNYGTLRNHPDSFVLNVNVGSDLQNYGTWAAQTTNLTSTTPQSIMFPQAHPCQSVNFNDTNSTSAVHAVGDIWFQNCSLSLNHSTLVLDSAPSGIYITNGNLLNAAVQSTVDNVINMSGGIITSVAFQSITNAGTLTLSSDTTVSGNLINTGTIQNSTVTSRALTVQGNITSYGYIRNNPDGFNLTVYCWGNIVRSGIINCDRVYINGTADQTINRGGTLAPAYFYLEAGYYVNQWYLNGSPSGYTSSQISIPIASDDVLGTWQPYYSSTGVWGRTITILPAELPAIPQNVWMEELQPGMAILHWNEALNATSYRIYVSDNPYSGFTLEWDNIIDPNPGNGTMDFTVATSDARKFFRIIARN